MTPWISAKAKTKAKKPPILIIFDHPEIPLHNNPAELGARKRVCKRLISFGTSAKDGTKKHNNLTWAPHGIPHKITL
jgi:hypothetical protein